MKKWLFCFLIFAFILSFTSTLRAQESLTISTYYPSPYGVYNELQISPNDDAHTCDANAEGTMYYDHSEHSLKICNDQSGYGWRAIGGTVRILSEYTRGDHNLNVSQGFCYCIEWNNGGCDGGASYKFRMISNSWNLTIAGNDCNDLPVYGRTPVCKVACVY